MNFVKMLTDGQVALLWHQLNVSKPEFESTVTYKDREAETRFRLSECYDEVNQGLWQALNAECQARGINPDTMSKKTVVRIEKEIVING